MARRRRNAGARRLLGLLMLAGIGAFVYAGVTLVRQELTADEQVVVLEIDNAIGATPSTIPIDPASDVRAAPQSIRIDDLELDQSVRSVGIEDSGELEVPDETEVGWYQYGSAPGLPGSTVLAAHVSWNGTIGPFHRLGELEPGDRVDVVEADGSTRVYAVVERAMFDKNELPTERVWNTTGDETLVLITCGGDYNPDIRRYRQNIVIFAVPVADGDNGSAEV